MISLSWVSAYEPNSLDLDPHIARMMGVYRQLPRHIAKKHLKAAMRRVVKPGVPLLRSLTPPRNTRRGRRKKGEKPRSTGALRRSVTAKAGWTGKNDDFDHFAWGVVGYKAGIESRKAIWLNNGTSRGILPYAMVDQVMTQMGPRVLQRMKQEMKVGLEKAAKELASGKNPGGNAGFRRK